MSIDTCKFCGNYVDTDDDGDCYGIHDIDSVYGDVRIDFGFCICASCRESLITTEEVDGCLPGEIYFLTNGKTVLVIDNVHVRWPDDSYPIATLRFNTWLEAEAHRKHLIKEHEGLPFDMYNFPSNTQWFDRTGKPHPKLAPNARMYATFVK